MNNKQIKMAIVGCGEHSHAHAKAIKKIKEIDLISCCDIEENKAIEWAIKYGCPSHYTNINKMIDNEKIDAIILCTWPKQHLEQIKICLSSGIKNILCEKSLALTTDEAVEIWKMTKSHHAFLMEGCMYRHHPAIQKLERILAYNDIGPIDSIRAVFSNYEPEIDSINDINLNWRLRHDYGGGVAYDWMSYCVNACNHFSGGTPQRVYATGNISNKYQVINRIYGMIEYDNGNVGIIESSKNANFSEMLQITCVNSILQLPIAWGIYGEVNILQHHRKEDWDYILTDKYKIEEADSFYLQLKNFCAVIKENDNPVIPLKESIINISTIESLVNSLTSKKIIDIQNIQFNND